MNTHKNNGKTLWTLPALSLVALSLTAGTGCDHPPEFLQGGAMEAAMNPSATMARFISPPIGTRLGFGDSMSRIVNPGAGARLEKVDSFVTARLVNPLIEARLEPADTAGIGMLR